MEIKVMEHTVRRVRADLTAEQVGEILRRVVADETGETAFASAIVEPQRDGGIRLYCNEVRMSDDATPSASTPEPDWSRIDEAMAAHLRALPQEDGWSLQHDRHMLGLAMAGLGVDDVCSAMSVRRPFVKARFDALLNRGKGAKGGELMRDDVHEALVALLPDES